jgi:hypothetical protein
MSAAESTVEAEILELEERLKAAELGPDPKFFENALDDNMVMVADDGKPFLAKSMVVQAHQPGKGPKFSRVEISDMKIVDHGTAAVVTCRGTYEGPAVSITLRFMRVWLRKSGGWKIIAGSVAKSD